MITVSQADELARRAHGQDRTRAGDLVIDHVRRVAGRVAGDPDPYAVVAALLHDSVEKGSLHWSDLRAVGADDRLLDVIAALTERDGESEPEYLGRCAADPLALHIKRADLIDKLHASAHNDLSADDVAQVRERASQRLDLLEQLARTPRRGLSVTSRTRVVS